MFNWFKSKDDNPPFRYTCACCGKEHEGLPAFSQKHPPYYLDVPEGERVERTFHNNDFCVVDDEYFFIRVTFHLPIIGHNETFEYGVWASQSKESYQRYNNTFNDDQSGMGNQTKHEVY